MKKPASPSPKFQASISAGAAESSLSFGYFRFVVLLLLLVGVVLYANSLHCSFQFDDGRWIVENPQTHNPFDLRAIWSADSPRFITNLTFAINYYFSGAQVVPFHVTNILIHVASSMLVFLWVGLTFQTPLIKQRFTRADAKEIALFSSLIFLCHPLQTQAVTYIVQRSAALATLFYLSAMVCYAEARLTANAKWYWGACVSCLLAMFSKQTAFTLPVMILIYERTFFIPENRTGRQKFLWYLPFLLALLVIPLVSLTNNQNTEVRFEGLPKVIGGVSRPEYLMTQFNVIRTYLRLLCFPAHQNLEYSYPVAHSLTEPNTLASFLLLAGIFSFALWIFRKQRLIAFGIFWFFVALSVESSIIPIPHVIFEHRVYLPLVGFALAISAGAFCLIKRKTLFRVLMIAFLVILSCLTVKRNLIWESKFSLWQDVVKKSPGLGSSHYSLGLSLAELGRQQEAIREYERSRDLGYETPRMDNDFARAYEALKDIPHAVQYYTAGIKADPTFAPAFNNLGALFMRLKKYDQALEVTQQAAELDPKNVITMGNLGAIYASLGRYDEATELLVLALRIDPTYVPAKKNLAKVREKMRADKDRSATVHAASPVSSAPVMKQAAG